LLSLHRAPGQGLLELLHRPLHEPRFDFVRAIDVGAENFAIPLFARMETGAGDCGECRRKDPCHDNRASKNEFKWVHAGVSRPE